MSAWALLARGVGGVPVMCRFHQRDESRDHSHSSYSYDLFAVEFDIVEVYPVEVG
mgnify:CR=1 FL=1